MRENLRFRRTEFMYSGKNYKSFYESRLEIILSNLNKFEDKISELLSETEKWIMEKLHSDQTIEKFEFSSKQLLKMKEERDKQFGEI